MRTGAQDIPVKNSGFKLTYEVKKDTDGVMRFFVTKDPGAVSGDFALYDGTAENPGAPRKLTLAADPGENSPAGSITGAYDETGKAK